MGSRSFSLFLNSLLHPAQHQLPDAHPRVFTSPCCTAPLPGVHLVMSTPLIRCVWPCAQPDKVEIRDCGICCCRRQHGLVTICPQIAALPGSPSFLRSELSSELHSPLSPGHTSIAQAPVGLQARKTAQGYNVWLHLAFLRGRVPTALDCLSKPCVCLCFYVPALLPPF